MKVILAVTTTKRPSLKISKSWQNRPSEKVHFQKRSSKKFPISGLPKICLWSCHCYTLAHFYVISTVVIQASSYFLKVVDSWKMEARKRILPIETYNNTRLVTGTFFYFDIWFLSCCCLELQRQNNTILNASFEIRHVASFVVQITISIALLMHYIRWASD